MSAADLVSRKCVPCEAGAPPLSEEAVHGYAAQLGAESGWQIADGSKIVKQFRFKDFRQSMSFLNRVAALAEAEGHHPDFWVSYRRVRMELTTHAIHGLSENDFIMAAKIDQVAAQS